MNKKTDEFLGSNAKKTFLRLTQIYPQKLINLKVVILTKKKFKLNI